MESGAIRAGLRRRAGRAGGVYRDGARAGSPRLEAHERERTGIRSLQGRLQQGLRLLHRGHARPTCARVPPDYLRKQTLVDGERYVTAELKEREALVLHAEERIAALEARAVSRRLLARARGRTARGCGARRRRWRRLDVLPGAGRGRASRAATCAPSLTTATRSRSRPGAIRSSRRTLDGGDFIANDTRCAGQDRRRPERLVAR